MIQHFVENYKFFVKKSKSYPQKDAKRKRTCIFFVQNFLLHLLDSKKYPKSQTISSIMIIQ